MVDRVRRISYNEPGDAHELTFSTYRRIKYFSDPDNCKLFLGHLQAARERQSFHIWAYVVMPEHVHLLVWPGPNLSKIADILKSIKQLFSRDLRKRGGAIHSRVWQPGGGYDRNLISEKAIRSVIDYIHMNPVRRGLCENPQDYLWSSAAWWYGTGTGVIQPDTRD